MYKIFIGCLGGRFLVKDGIVVLSDGSFSSIRPSDTECKELNLDDLLKVYKDDNNKEHIKAAFMELIND